MIKLAKIKFPRIERFILVILLVLIGAVVAYSPSDNKKTKSVQSNQSFQSPVKEATNEASLLNPPPETASQEEIKTFSENVNRLAKSSSSIEIKNCSATPMALRIKNGQMITIKNLDSTNHTLVFNSDLNYTILANNTEEVNLTFKDGSKIYSYGCDLNEGISGFVLVE